MREQRVGRDRAVRQIERRRKLLAFGARELEAFGRHGSVLLLACGCRSVPRIALFGPGITAVVIAAHFPKTRLSSVQEFDRLQPFRALPEIEMRHDEPHRAAMLGFERLHPTSYGRAARPQQRNRQATGWWCSRQAYAAPRSAHPRLRLAGLKEIACRKAFPLIVVARPGRDTVNVGDELRLRLRGELRQRSRTRDYPPRHKRRAASARAKSAASAPRSSTGQSLVRCWPGGRR